MPPEPQHERAPRVAEVCAEDVDVLALSVVRFVASGYMTGDVACWDAAHDGAERLLGPAEGSDLVAALVGVMRAIRRERTEDWRFMPATCCRVTADERALVDLLAQGRQGAWEAVAAGAARLAGRSEAPGLSAAIRHAVAALRLAGPRLATIRSAPAGTVLH
jgi:hypothetical protein